MLLHLVRSVLPETPAVFVDTGLEFPEIKEFVKKQDNVMILRPEMSFKQVIKNYGYPLISKQEASKIRKLRHSRLSDKYRNYLLNGDERGKYGMLAKKWQYLVDAPFDISEKCCDIMKKKPMKKYSKQTQRVPIVGTMACESRIRAKAWFEHGCNMYDKNNAKSAPMSFWTEQDVLQYIIDNSLEYASVYGDIIKSSDGNLITSGAHRTGCVYCGFGCHLEKYPNRFQMLKQTHPKLWEYCMEERGLNMKKVLEYIGVDVD